MSKSFAVSKSVQQVKRREKLGNRIEKIDHPYVKLLAAQRDDVIGPQRPQCRGTGVSQKRANVNQTVLSKQSPGIQTLFAFGYRHGF